MSCNVLQLFHAKTFKEALESHEGSEPQFVSQSLNPVLKGRHDCLPCPAPGSARVHKRTRSPVQCGRRRRAYVFSKPTIVLSTSSGRRGTEAQVWASLGHSRGCKNTRHLLSSGLRGSDQALRRCSAKLFPPVALSCF